ncbi:MAG: hypothetical protein H7Z13_18930 [Ferruginibacter sp.]|nr:hypothetical protein [Ferruginibacter sp.]
MNWLVRKARNALYWTAGLVFAGEMIAMFNGGGEFNIYILIISLIEAGIFVTLAFWTRKRPYTAIIAGPIAFIGIILFSAIANTFTDGGVGFLKAIFSGFIVKAIILINLIKALRDGKTLQNALEEKT